MRLLQVCHSLSELLARRIRNHQRYLIISIKLPAVRTTTTTTTKKKKKKTKRTKMLHRGTRWNRMIGAIHKIFSRRNGTTFRLHRPRPLNRKAQQSLRRFPRQRWRQRRPRGLKRNLRLLQLRTIGIRMRSSTMCSQVLVNLSWKRHDVSAYQWVKVIRKAKRVSISYLCLLSTCFLCVQSKTTNTYI